MRLAVQRNLRSVYLGSALPHLRGLSGRAVKLRKRLRVEQVSATRKHVCPRTAVRPETRRRNMSYRFGVPGPLLQDDLICHKFTLGLLHGRPFTGSSGKRQRGLPRRIHCPVRAPGGQLRSDTGGTSGSGFRNCPALHLHMPCLHRRGHPRSLRFVVPTHLRGEGHLQGLACAPLACPVSRALLQLGVPGPGQGFRKGLACGSSGKLGHELIATNPGFSLAAGVAMTLCRGAHGVNLRASGKPHAPQKGMLRRARNKTGDRLLSMHLPLLGLTIRLRCTGKVTYRTVRRYLAEGSCTVPVEVQRLRGALRGFLLVCVGEANIVREARMLRVVIGCKNGGHLRGGYRLQTVVHGNRSIRVSCL